MEKKRFSIWLIVVVVCLWPSIACSISTAELDSLRSLFNLDEVEVVANHQSSIINNPLGVLSSQTLSGIALEALQAQSVADAIRYFSGVQVKDYGGVGGLKTIDVRAMGSQHVGVFYDGIEIGNAQNGTVDLGKFSMDNMESISLYHAQPTQVLLSAKEYASASTVYLRTHRPQFDKGKTYNVSIGMKAGAFGLANPSLRYEQRLGNNFFLSTHAEYFYSTGRYHYDGGIRQNGEIQTARAELALYGLLPYGNWQVRGYYYYSTRGIPRAIIRNVHTSDEHQWDRNAFVQGSLEHSWALPSLTDGGTFRLAVKGKYSNDYLRYCNPDTTRYAFDERFTQQEAYLSAALQYDIFSWWDIRLSGDYQYNNLQSSKIGMEHIDRHRGYVALATDWHYKWVHANLAGVGQFIESSHFSPSAMVGVQPILKEDWFLSAMYKQNYRMPSFNDLYYGEVGVSNLRPENAHQLELCTDYAKVFAFAPNSSRGMRSVTLSMGLAGFYNRITDKIVALPKGNTQFRWSMLNIGEVEDKGCEAKVGLVLALPQQVELALNGNYTYQRAQDKSDPKDITYNGQIAYIPEHSGSALARLTWRGLTLNYAFTYVGERYTGSVNSKKHHLDAWSTHDICVGYTWQFAKNPKKLYTGLEFNNLMNQHYEIIKNYPMPGFNGKLIMRVDF